MEDRRRIIRHTLDVTIARTLNIDIIRISPTAIARLLRAFERLEAMSMISDGTAVITLLICAIFARLPCLYRLMATLCLLYAACCHAAAFAPASERSAMPRRLRAMRQEVVEKDARLPLAVMFVTPARLLFDACFMLF